MSWGVVRCEWDAVAARYRTNTLHSVRLVKGMHGVRWKLPASRGVRTMTRRQSARAHAPLDGRRSGAVRVRMWMGYGRLRHMGDSSENPVLSLAFRKVQPV